MIKQQLNSLTGLRFIAAMLVVLHHFGNPSSPRLIHNVLSHGFVAVTLFFILSGFILTFSYADCNGKLRGSLREFWVARFARIYPVYLLGFVIYAPFAYAKITAAGTASPLCDTALFGAAALALVQSWSTVTVGVWNPPGWSLGAEAFFYLVFPLLAPLILRLRLRRLALLAVVLWVISVAAPFADLAGANFNRDFWMFNPLLRLPEFLLGIVLGKCWQVRAPGKLERYAAVLSIGAAMLIVAVLSLGVRESMFFNGVLAPLMMVLIYSLACGRGVLARLLATKPMVKLGEASYSLYILHWPLWLALTYFFVNYLGKFQAGPGNFAACLVPVVIASVLSFKFLEHPANSYLKKRFSSKAHQAAIPVVREAA